VLYRPRADLPRILIPDEHHSKRTVTIS
jgi:hypothetical protein